MAKFPDQLLRWKKASNITTFVLPNSEVQPEVICAASDEFLGVVRVHRVYEHIVRQFFSASEVVALEKLSETTIDGKVHILYETWKAPHLPPTNRHTKYVFEARGQDSAPLYVCAPVQITIETGSKASAGAGGLVPGLRGSVDRSKIFNMQVSAPVDPTLTFDVITHPGSLYEAIYRYADEISKGQPFKGKEIAEYIAKRYEEYIDGKGRVSVPKINDVTLGEGEVVTIPLEFRPVRNGRALLIVSATDEQGDEVFSDFIGLYCDTKTRSVTREF